MSDFIQIVWKFIFWIYNDHVIKAIENTKFDMVKIWPDMEYYEIKLCDIQYGYKSFVSCKFHEIPKIFCQV